MQPPLISLPDPSPIMQVGMGFMASKTLLTAVKMGLFTELGSSSLGPREIQKRLNLHDRSLFDFLDALHSLGFLNREGMGENATYSNTEATSMFLNKNNLSYIGGLLEMSNDRLYGFWGNLEEGLRSGKPQNEVKHTEDHHFERLYANPEHMQLFLEAMAGAQMGNFLAFARSFDFSKYKTLCDVGGASGQLSIIVAMHQPHMTCTSFDLPVIEPAARSIIGRFPLNGRVTTGAGDFFKDDFPKADIIFMGNILHDWGLSDKKSLIRKAFDALPPGGAFVVIECIIDDDRRTNTYGLLVSLTMLIETHEGFDFTFGEFTSWTQEIGFRETRLMPLTGPSSAAIAYK
ncbi:MAG TPA: methyltransferase [Bacteroidota bacterium]|nr:methyltransferase [Bacteroidota bacterium]